jgi:hypothetical protein
MQQYYPGGAWDGAWEHSDPYSVEEYVSEENPGDARGLYDTGETQDAKE